MMTIGYVSRGVMVGCFVLMCSYVTDLLLSGAVPGWDDWRVKFSVLIPLAIVYGVIGLTLLAAASTTKRTGGGKRR